MFGSIINRLIFTELVKVFLMSLTALTGLFLLAGLIQEATRAGIAPAQILNVIPLMIPNTLPFTIPSTTLFATCVVYGRMAHDNEVLVLKSAGVNILHLLKPAILLGILTSSATMFLYYDTIPRTQRQLRVKLMSDAEDVIYGLLKREGYMRQGNQYTMYVREVQGKRLLDVIYKRRAPHGNGYDLVVRSREATIRVDLPNNQILIDMGRYLATGQQEGRTANVVPTQLFNIALPPEIFGKDFKNRPSALTWEEVQERVVELRHEAAKADRDLAEALARKIKPEATEAELKGHFGKIAAAKYESDHQNRSLRYMEAELSMRPALAMGCLCFVLIGCPVGIWASRADYLSTFVICFLPTVFIYYPLVLAGGNLAKDGKVPLEIGFWSADMFLGTASLFLIWRLMRR